MGSISHALCGLIRMYCKRECKEYSLCKSRTANTGYLYTEDGQERKTSCSHLYTWGGWTGGDKSNAASKPAFFTEKGYVFVSVNYRLHPDVQYGDMAYDVAKAVKWVEDHADEYQIDQSKINIMGHSAGGHLAGLIAADAKYLNSVGLKPASLNSIVILDGPLNLKQFIEAIPSYKKVFGPDEKVWTEASPLTYMNNQNLPPAYLVTRWADPSVYQFAAALNKAKGSDFVYQVKNLSHSGLNKMFGSPDAPQEAQDMTKAVMAFLEKKNK